MTDSPDHIANLFIAYLRDNKTDSKHVFRVASWIGMLALAIDAVKLDWHKSNSRQLVFDANAYGGKTPTNRYKVRYNHRIGTRGGLEIVEVGMSQGQPEIDTVASFRSLNDVALFYTYCTHRAFDFSMALAAYNAKFESVVARLRADTSQSAVIP